MDDRKLQVAILAGLITVSGIVISVTPDSWKSFNLFIFKLAGITFIVLGVMALVVLGLSQIQKKEEQEEKLIKSYEKAFKYSILLGVAVITLGLSLNVSLNFSPKIHETIKQMSSDNFNVWTTVILFIFIVWYLNKRGIKLFGGEDG